MTAAGALQFRGNSFELESTPCDFCGSDDFIPFWTKMRFGLNLPTVFCRRCGLCQSHPRPTPSALERFYSKLYNDFHDRPSPIDPNDEYVRRSARTAAPRVALLKRFVDPNAELRVLEIGAGVGQFQRIAREETRWRLEGIEPGQAQAAFCRSLGLNVTNVFLDGATHLEEGAFDVVVSFHVFEHVLEPSRFIRRAAKLVKPGGLLHIEVPNLPRPGATFDHFLQFPHLYNFSAVTLRNYLSAIGGLRPLHTAERAADLVVVSRRPEGSEPREGRPAAGEFETYDVENFITRLRMLSRVYKVADRIPKLPILDKVRGNLFGI